MAPKTIKTCHKPSEFIAAVEKQGGTVEICGKGVKIFGPDGRRDQYAVIHAWHPRDLATGTRAALIKGLLSIGFAGLIACGVLSQTLYGGML